MKVEEIIRNNPGIDHGLSNQSKMAYEAIIQDRFQRLQSSGVVIKTYSYKRKKDLYIQDPQFSTTYKWTQYKANAQCFKNEVEAIMYAKEHNLENIEIEIK